MPRGLRQQRSPGTQPPAADRTVPGDARPGPSGSRAGGTGDARPGPSEITPGLPGRDVVPDGHVVVARIGRAHGITGQVTVEVRTDAPELRLADGAELTASGLPGRPTLTVEASQWHSGRLLLRLAGVSDRTAAEGLRGVLLSVPGGGEVPDGGDDDFWDHQLVGLTAYDADGRRQGVVTDVLHLPGGDTLVLEHEGGERMLPFLRAFIPTVDVVGGRLVVTPPEGLWEA